MKNLPNKIYIPRTNMEVENHLEEFWVDHKTFNDDVEYIRTNAFIEKACEFISHRVFNCAEGSIIEDFKNYMKGE